MVFDARVYQLKEQRGHMNKHPSTGLTHACHRTFKVLVAAVLLVGPCEQQLIEIFENTNYILPGDTTQRGDHTTDLCLVIWQLKPKDVFDTE
jgi:hypothetical protein